MINQEPKTIHKQFIMDLSHSKSPLSLQDQQADSLEIGREIIKSLR